MARNRFEMTDRDVRLATADISPENIGKELARFARSELSEAIINGEASPTYDKFVNGREGAEEETVVPPGPILYVFSYWEPIIEFALAYLERESPIKTGRYKASHQIMIGSQFISPSTPISSGEVVKIVATTPYARKIEVGHMQMTVPHLIYQRAGKEIARQFGKSIRVRVSQTLIPGGYVLKGVFSRGVQKFSRTKLQKDTMAGQPMRYPTIILETK